MKRVVVVELIIVGMILTGCNSIEAKPIATSKATPTIQNKVIIPDIASNIPANSIDTSQLIGFDTNASSAIAPAQIDIGNMYAGATAEFEIIIHNGDGLKSKLLQIETERDETIAAIPLSVVLANSGLLDIISIDSTLKDEHLEAISYDASTKLLTIKGFIPSTKRIVKITYKTISIFNIYYKEPTDTKNGFDKPETSTPLWVTFDNSNLQLRPMENGKVTVTLKIPEEVKIEASKWEFWIAVMERSAGSNAQVATEIELCSRIFVTMR